MKNKKKNSKNILSENLLLSVIALSLSGCAHQEKMPVNVQDQAVTKVAQKTAPKLQNPAPPPAPYIEPYALEVLLSSL